MGNTTSTEQSDIGSLSTQIDEIAIHYILNQNTIDLLRLTDKEYYDNLIILTGNVIEKKLNHLELGFLNQRIFGKSSIGEVLDIVPANTKLKEKVIFNISKFYIKIIMIYSAIATTIDPQYAYEDENGVKKLFYLKDMDAYKHIPKSVKPVLVQLTNPLNLCRKRLSILKNKLDFNVDDTFIKINPGEKLCSLSTTNLLTDEVGIKELDSLYYDIFDYNTKSWSKRSKKMKMKYNKDLILFYQIFTGKQVKPAEIKSFHDIELLDMSTLEQCNDVRFMQDILVKKNDVLIQQYIQKINMIEETTKKYKSKLIGILKELFVIKLTDNETTYTINPDLTLDHIINIETETRDTILNLYTSCEKYFIQGLIIFEKIYDEQVKTLNVERLNYIDKIKTPPPEVIEQTPEPVFMPEEMEIKPIEEPIEESNEEGSFEEPTFIDSSGEIVQNEQPIGTYNPLQMGQSYTPPIQPYSQTYTPQMGQPYGQTSQPYGQMSQQYGQMGQPYGQMGQQYAPPMQSYSQTYTPPMQPYGQMYTTPMQPYGQMGQPVMGQPVMGQPFVQSMPQIKEQKANEPKLVIESITNKDDTTKKQSETTDQGTTEQGMTDQGTTEQGTSEQVKSDQGTTEEVKTEQGTTEEVKTEQGTTDQGTTEEVKTEEVKTDQGTTEQGTTKEEIVSTPEPKSTSIFGNLFKTNPKPPSNTAPSNTAPSNTASSNAAPKNAVTSNAVTTNPAPSNAAPSNAVTTK